MKFDITKIFWEWIQTNPSSYCVYSNLIVLKFPIRVSFFTMRAGKA